MKGYEINELVSNNFFIGSEQLRPYKKIIQKSAYPSFNHSFSLDIATETIEAYEQSGGSIFNTIELTVFFLECGTHFSSDFGGDMGEEFYEVLENTFEDLLKKLKKSDDTNLFDNFAPRLRALIEIGKESGWGYGDQLEDYWQECFSK